MVWDWMPAIISLLAAGLIWGWLAWGRASLRRLRRYDEAMEKFAQAAHRLLKYDDLPEDIVNFIEIINNVTESPRLSTKAIRCLISSELPRREKERIHNLEAFFDRHEDARRWFEQMVDAGLRAVFYRASLVCAFRLWLIGDVLRRLLRRNMLREEAVAVAIGQNTCHQGG